LSLATGGFPDAGQVESAGHLQAAAGTIRRQVQSGDLTPGEARVAIGVLKDPVSPVGTVRDIGYAIPGVGSFLSLQDAQRSGFAPLESGFFVVSAAFDGVLFFLPLKTGGLKVVALSKNVVNRIPIKVEPIPGAIGSGPPVRFTRRRPSTSAEELDVLLAPLKKASEPKRGTVTKERAVVIPETAPSGPPKVTIPVVKPTRGPLKIPTVKRSPTPELPATKPRPKPEQKTQVDLRNEAARRRREAERIRVERLRQATKERALERAKERQAEINRQREAALRAQEIAKTQENLGPASVPLTDFARIAALTGKPNTRFTRRDSRILTRSVTSIEVLTQADAATMTRLLTRTRKLTQSEVQQLSDILAKTRGLTSTEAETVTSLVNKTQPLTQTETKTLTDLLTETKTEPKTKTATVAKPKTETKPETKPDTKPDTKPVAGTKTEPVVDTEPLTDPEPATRPQPATITEPFTEPLPVTQPITEPARLVEAPPATKTPPSVARPPGSPVAPPPTKPPPTRPVKPPTTKRPPIPRFELPGGKRLPPGVFPERVRWKQGFSEVTLNMLTGQATFRPTAITGQPSKTFRVVSTTTNAPEPRFLPLGIVNITIRRNGLIFRRSDRRPLAVATSPISRVRFA